MIVKATIHLNYFGCAGITNGRKSKRNVPLSGKIANQKLLLQAKHFKAAKNFFQRVRLKINRELTGELRSVILANKPVWCGLF
jgi:hypothetical protein